MDGRESERERIDERQKRERLMAPAAECSGRSPVFWKTSKLRDTGHRNMNRRVDGRPENRRQHCEAAAEEDQQRTEPSYVRKSGRRQ